MNARPASRAFLFATAFAAAASLALPPVTALAQATTGPANRANTQQGTAAGQMPAQGGGMSGGGGGMSSDSNSSATTGPSNKANTKQGTVATGTKKQHARKHAGNSQHTAHSGTSGSGSGTAPTGGPANKANIKQGTSQQ